MTSIRLHLISGAGQHGSVLALRNEPGALTAALTWAMVRAAEFPITPTLVVVHEEAAVLLAHPLDVPDTPEGKRTARERLVDQIADAWDRAEDDR